VAANRAWTFREQVCHSELRTVNECYGQNCGQNRRRAERKLHRFIAINLRKYN
jgi:hypothetical protein